MLPNPVRLNDFRYAAMLRSPFVREMQAPTGFYPAFDLHRLLWAWNVALETEGAHPPRYSPSFAAAFEGKPRRVPFTDLPYGLQTLLGGSATDAWYEAAAVEAQVGDGDAPRRLTRDVVALVGSSWASRTAAVSELAPALLSHWAVAHLWSQAEAHLLVPTEWGFNFREVMQGQRPMAPVVFYGGAIHRDSVLYALALLRFASADTPVTVLEGMPGTPLPGAPVPAPPYPASAWTADGTRLRSAEDPLPSPVERDVLAARVEREVTAGSTRARDAVVEALWSAMGIGRALGGTPSDVAAAGGELPYRSQTPSLAEQVTWSRGTTVETTRRGETGVRRLLDAVVSWLPSAIAPQAVREMRRMEQAAKAQVLAQLRGAEVTRYLPELAELVA